MEKTTIIVQDPDLRFRLIKSERPLESSVWNSPIIEFYDTESDAESAATSWKKYNNSIS